MREYHIAVAVTRFGFVAEYYHRRAWHDAGDWYAREQAGKPPIVVEAVQKNGKLFTTKDVRCGPIHDDVNILVDVSTSGNEEDKAGFDILHRVAEKLRWSGAFSREMLFFHQSNKEAPFRAALVSNAGDGPLSRYGSSDCAGRWVGQVKKVFPEGYETYYESKGDAPPSVTFWVTEKDLE